MTPKGGTVSIPTEEFLELVDKLFDLEKRFRALGLEQYGKVRVGKYEISLGGRDGTLLNRRVRK